MSKRKILLGPAEAAATARRIARRVVKLLRKPLRKPFHSCVASKEVIEGNLLRIEVTRLGNPSVVIRVLQIGSHFVVAQVEGERCVRRKCPVAQL